MHCTNTYLMSVTVVYPISFIITRITRKQGSACLPAVRYLVGRILHRKHKGVGSIPVVGMLHCVSDNVPV